MAQRHPTASRRSSEAREEADDAFVASVFELSVWARKNSQLLILSGVVLALALGGVLYYVSYRNNLNRQAVAELEQVQQTLAIGDLDNAKAQLTSYLERFRGSPQAAEARLLLGQLYLTTDQPEQALQVLGERGSLRDPMGVQVGNLTAKAYEDLGRLADAERQYVAVAEAAPLGFQRREALTDAARVRSLLGNHAGAAELYRRILEDLDQSADERGVYEMLLAEAEHAAKG